MILLNVDMADKKSIICFLNLNQFLQETYGVIVYQEQVMKIASAIGGYTLGEADILRRAMGKKKAEVMAEQKEYFCEQVQKNITLMVKKLANCLILWPILLAMVLINLTRQPMHLLPIKLPI